MFKIVTTVLGAAMLVGASAAGATPYTFSGTLTQAGLFDGASNADWAFAEGQRFSGTVTYDAAAVTRSDDYIDDDAWKLTFHTNPVTAMSVVIDLGNGRTYRNDVVTQNGYVAIGAAKQPGGGWTGADLRMQNYNWDGTPITAPDPASMVGSYYAHSTSLWLYDYAAAPLGDTAPSIDLARLFANVSDAQLSIRFSDPANWTVGFEHLDGIVYGRVDSFSALASGVPEPATWALMILGFGAVGGALRRRRVAPAALA